MRNRRIFALLAALLLVLGLLAGCGSDDEGGETTNGEASGEALSTEEYETQVNDLSASFNTEFSSLGEQAAAPESPEAYTETVGEIEALLEQHVADLEEIEPPEEAATIHAEIVGTYSDMIDAFATVREAVEGGDAQEIQEEATRLSEESTTLNDELNDLVEQASEQGIEIEQLNSTPAGG
jgi:hypothetical protein